jgi:hypothetical protein
MILTHLVLLSFLNGAGSAGAAAPAVARDTGMIVNLGRMMNRR